MNTKDSLFLHLLNTFGPFGPARLMRITGYFENFEAAFKATAGELMEAGIEPEVADKWTAHKRTLDPDREMANLERERIHLLTYKDTSYPRLLLEIPKNPPILYYRGSMENADELCIAVVGTRKITNYGRVVTPLVIEPLILSGATIVSGLAYGVDALAQELAHKNGKRTIAVLGGGIDEKTLYPKDHVWLADQILENGGAIVSEYPIGTPPLKHHFLARNRIISGMSVGTVVVECDLHSGSLITANYALEQNRQLFAVPGPIYSEQSKGPNNLIKLGAKPITEAKDVLSELNLKTLPEQLENQDLFGQNPTEAALLAVLGYEPLIVNEIIKKCGLPAGEVTSALTFLEMKGKVRNLGGQQYVLAR